MCVCCFFHCHIIIIITGPTQQTYYACLVIDLIGYISEMSQPYSGDDGSFVIAAISYLWKK